jgi:hypothetical protein
MLQLTQETFCMFCFHYAQVPIEQQQQQLATATRMASAELRAPAAAGAGGAQPGPMKFVDRDEHVYFWFPLLAGLSELTFDPRQEIRRSSLEVWSVQAWWQLLTCCFCRTASVKYTLCGLICW